MRRVVCSAVLAIVAAGAVAPPAIGDVTAQPVATGLEFPASFDVASGGTVVVAERRTGKIISIDAGGTRTLLATVPGIVSTGEQGLLSIALHPRYPEQRKIFAYATRTAAGGVRAQVLRITLRTLDPARISVLRSLPSSNAHVGGALTLSGKHVFVVIGDHTDPAFAQDLSSIAGKVLRMRRSGAIPSDNPFPGSLVWASGIRNSFGLAVDPVTRFLWETDNGPECTDEINLIERGGNFGWGENASCTGPQGIPGNTNVDGLDPVLPVHWWDVPDAPTGISFCRACGLPGAEDGMVVGQFNTGELRLLGLSASRNGVVSDTMLYDHTSGVLSVERAPEGPLYFSDPTAVYRLMEVAQP